MNPRALIGLLEVGPRRANPQAANQQHATPRQPRANPQAANPRAKKQVIPLCASSLINSPASAYYSPFFAFSTFRGLILAFWFRFRDLRCPKSWLLPRRIPAPSNIPPPCTARDRRVGQTAPRLLIWPNNKSTVSAGSK